MIQEYQYMDRPLKYPRNPEPSPITSITDKSIFLNQRNDWIPKKQFHQTGHLINSYPSIILDKVIIHRQPITEMKYLEETDRNNLFKRSKFCKNSNVSIFDPSSLPLCLPSFLILPFSIPHQKHSQQQSPTMTLFNILLSHITMPNIQNGISTMPTCSLPNKAFYLAFININSIILISLDN